MPLPPAILQRVASLLAPFFLDAKTSHAEAQDAAMQALLHQQPETVLDLLAVARALAFSLAAMGTLSRAAEPDQAPEMAHKFTAAATRLSQSADRAQRSLSQRSLNQRSLSQRSLSQRSNAVRSAPVPPGVLPQPAQGSRPLTLADAPWADALADLAAEMFTSRPDNSAHRRPPAAPS